MLEQSLFFDIYFHARRWITYCSFNCWRSFCRFDLSLLQITVNLYQLAARMTDVVHRRYVGFTGGIDFGTAVVTKTRIIAKTRSKQLVDVIST